MADPADTYLTYNKVKTAFTYNLYDDMDHYSFQVGKNMTYIDDTLALLDEYDTTGFVPNTANKHSDHTKKKTKAAINQSVKDKIDKSKAEGDMTIESI